VSSVFVPPSSRRLLPSSLCPSSCSCHRPERDECAPILCCQHCPPRSSLPQRLLGPLLARPALSLPSEPPQMETPTAHLFILPLSLFILPDRSFFPLLTRPWDGLRQRGCAVSPGCRTSACGQGRGRAALLSRVVLIPYFACLTFHTCVTLVVLLLASFYHHDYRSYIIHLSSSSSSPEREINLLFHIWWRIWVVISHPTTLVRSAP
jgi:hypothetical protein